MRSEPLEVVGGLGVVVTCVYGPAVAYAFPDPLITAYRHSVIDTSELDHCSRWVQVRKVVEGQQRVLTRVWDPLIFGYSPAACFDSSAIRMESWTDAARKVRRSLPMRCDVRDVNIVLQKAQFENKPSLYNDGRS